jgi:hypothetical protein
MAVKEKIQNYRIEITELKGNLVLKDNKIKILEHSVKDKSLQIEELECKFNYDFTISEAKYKQIQKELYNYKIINKIKITNMLKTICEYKDMSD